MTNVEVMLEETPKRCLCWVITSPTRQQQPMSGHRCWNKNRVWVINIKFKKKRKKDWSNSRLPMIHRTGILILCKWTNILTPDMGILTHFSTAKIPGKYHHQELYRCHFLSLGPLDGRVSISDVTSFDCCVFVAHCSDHNVTWTRRQRQKL